MATPCLRRFCKTRLTFRTSADAFARNFPTACFESGAGAVSGLGDAQQAEELALQVGEFEVEELDGLAGLGETVALGESEQTQNLARRSFAGADAARDRAAVRRWPRVALPGVARAR
jgi:hypothetical protein